METKWVLHIAMMLLTFCSAAQPTEEQFKFSLPDSLTNVAFVYGLKTKGSLPVYFHSDYTYYDVYLDTPDDLLLKSGFSLRMRKRVWPDSTLSYSMQLKSEMGDSSAVRLEVEEKELDFYRTRNEAGDTLFLVQLMDRLFETMDSPDDAEKNGGFQSAKGQIEAWLQQMAGGSITPFQYLKHFDGTIFTTDRIASLKVKAVGISHRWRGHVYVDENNPFGIQPYYGVHDEIPAFFVANPGKIWLMETSLDHAVFYLDGKKEPVELREFEVEKKFQEDAIAREKMEAFIEEIVRNLELKPQTSSKYRQVRASEQ